MSDEPRSDEGGGGEAAELLALVSRLEGILSRSGLGELEVEAGETTLVLRTAAAVAPPSAMVAAPAVPRAAAGDAAPAAPIAKPPGHHAVVAPLTGIFYSAPTPDSAPYVNVGAEVVVGQVIGLIEAMKLFNEIKSDANGRVARLVAETGKLVKAKQPLIEVDRT
ncbi:MAG: acetyl-CoA carboxylase biotin carboxyl carrier protein [Candidatus Limnocylindrales bacterium]